MNRTDPALPDVLRHSPTRVVFGPGTLATLGETILSEPPRPRGGRHVLLVTDPGIRAAGHVARAVTSLESAGLHVTAFDGVKENPTCDHVYAGVSVAREANIDFIVGLGGGSSMDCAKGINLVLTNGEPVQRYWGEGKATAAMLPMIAVPTTAGTGSEAQSFALITDPVTHQKMACGDRRLPTEGGLRPRVAILDPELTASQPARVVVASTIDAIAHAIETAGTNRRSDTSLALSREAWALLDGACARAIAEPDDADARAAMLIGAHLAGAAIEQSMLGAAHACANPLTARFGITHGIAVGVMLPHVIRFNAEPGENPYEPLGLGAEALAARVESLLDRAGVARSLREHGVPAGAIPDLADSAAAQWTAKFNPRPVGPTHLAMIYHAAMA